MAKDTREAQMRRTRRSLDGDESFDKQAARTLASTLAIEAGKARVYIPATAHEAVVIAEADAVMAQRNAEARLYNQT